MKSSLDLTHTRPILRLDSEVPQPDDDPALLYLSVTSHVENADGEVEERNTFIGVRKSDLSALDALIHTLLEQ